MAEDIVKSFEPIIEDGSDIVQVKKDEILKVKEEIVSKLRLAKQTEEYCRVGNRSFRFPVKFSSIEEEANFLAIKNLLDFGSYFESDIKRLIGKNIEDVLAFGCLGLHISKGKLDTEFLVGIDVTAISTSFGLTTEKKIMDAVYQDEYGPLWELAERMRKVLNNTGRILRARQLPSLGHFIMKAITHSGFEQSAVQLVKSLVESFDDLNDEIEYKGHKFEISRKANNIVIDLFSRFCEEDKRFQFSDMNELVPSGDPKLVLVLRHIGVMKLNDTLSDEIDVQQKEIPEKSSSEAHLRAFSCFAIIQLYKQLLPLFPELYLFELEAWLKSEYLKDYQLLAPLREHMTKTSNY